MLPIQPYNPYRDPLPSRLFNSTFSSTPQGAVPCAVRDLPQIVSSPLLPPHSIESSKHSLVLSPTHRSLYLDAQFNIPAAAAPSVASVPTHFKSVPTTWTRWSVRASACNFAYAARHLAERRRRHHLDTDPRLFILGEDSGISSGWCTAGGHRECREVCCQVERRTISHSSTAVSRLL